MLEIIAMTKEDAIRIENGGGERIELVRNLSEGGLTPKMSMVEDVIQAVMLPVNVIIRPHSRSFVYDLSDTQLMIANIQACKELGANGVVFGALNIDGTIDLSKLEVLIKAAEGMEITFHRAIDELKDPVEGIRILSQYNEIKTILTSGGKGQLMENLKRINEMSIHAGHLALMIGGGLTLENFSLVIKETKCQGFHFGRGVREANSVDGGIDESQVVKAHRILKEQTI